MPRNGEANDTVIVLQKVLTWFEILNARSLFKDERTLNPNFAEIRAPNDLRPQKILDFGDMAYKMMRKQGFREKRLSRDTAQNL